MGYRRTSEFPFTFLKNGRFGKVYRLNTGNFGTYFLFAGVPKRNTFKTFEAACLYLDGEFSKLDTDRSNALSQNPLNSDVRNYSELEQLLRREGDGATLREAVTFFLANHKSKRFTPKTVVDCTKMFIVSQRANNVSPSQIQTLEKHYRRFKLEFGSRRIHEITALEIAEWLATRKDEKTGEPWSTKTRTSNLGSLVSLALYAQDTLRAIPDFGKNEFQKVRRPKKDERAEVEIYSATEIKDLLFAAIETDIDMIPALVTGAFQGLRPAEFHAEGARRRALTWEAFIWDDNALHITGQKVRSKANRDILLHSVTRAWLYPLKKEKGEIWKHKQAHTKKLIAVRKKAKVRSVYDGLRHSYASYRIRLLKGNLAELAQEMGNSPREIINSYKRNVTDAQALEWFAVMPPAGYGEKIKAVLAQRKA
jgi:hypothetical protein